MTKAGAKKRIEKLRKIIRKQRYLYHVKDAAEISDAALDSLKHELAELEDQFPELIKIIYDSYYQNMDLFEKLSIQFRLAVTGSIDAWRMSLYFTELLLKYEPTIASTKFIGDFQTYNLNYLIIQLNEVGENFLLEDSTVAFLIKRRNFAYAGQPRDREFDKLVELWEYNLKEKIF